MKRFFRFFRFFSLLFIVTFLGVNLAYGYRIQFSKEKWADFAIRGQLFYFNMDKRSKDVDYRQNYFEMTEAEFYVKGQINKLVQFFTQWECYYKPYKLSGKKRDDSTKAYMKETGVNLVFRPEFMIRFGRQRIPVSRYHQRSDYKKLIPTDYFYRYDIHGVFKGKVNEYLNTKETCLQIRHPGVTALGYLFDGMLEYHLGLFNQPNNKRSDWNPKGKEGEGYKGVRPTVRLVFTPTWWGYKPEKSIKGTRGDSYLGKRDVFNIGIGYSREEIWDDLDNDMFAIDGIWEKRLGKDHRYVPMLQWGFIYSKDSHYDYNNGEYGNKKKDSQYWWVAGQFLYNKFVGYGKPAIGARFEQMNADDAYNNKDLTSNRISITLNYYIKGYSAWLAVGVDHVRYTNGAKEYLLAHDKQRNMTDFYTYFQFKF
ncbi:MAG: hypothetical protein LWW94_06795 [Candidatus Desulfofervidaceae bacterium]|nr:hypothetical protein [Candidatus Desulfofervidaceae bacterium]